MSPRYNFWNRIQDILNANPTLYQLSDGSSVMTYFPFCLYNTYTIRSSRNVDAAQQMKAGGGSNWLEGLTHLRKEL